MTEYYYNGVRVVVVCGGYRRGVVGLEREVLLRLFSAGFMGEKTSRQWSWVLTGRV